MKNSYVSGRFWALSECLPRMTNTYFEQIYEQPIGTIAYAKSSMETIRVVRCLRSENIL